jgi:hypothetical protein
MLKKLIGGQRFMSVLLAVLVLGALPITLEAFTKDFLIWDPDPNYSSGPIIRATLLGLGYSGDYTTGSLPGNLTDYRSIWICLGVPFDNYSLSSAEGDQLVAYVTGQDSTNIYMEGADTWVIDPPTSIHPFFHIIGLRNGSGDTDEIIGQPGTFTEGMIFYYNGENLFLDHLDPDSFSFAILADTNNASGFDYFIGIAYDNGTCTYKTVGTSFEFGGLDDISSPTPKADLADSIMSFFCIPKPIGMEEEPLPNLLPKVFALSQSKPNPAGSSVQIHYDLPARSRVHLVIYDITGRVVRVLVDESREAGYRSIVWDGRDSRGKEIASGVYFYKLSARSDSGREDYSATRKLILMR